MYYCLVASLEQFTLQSDAHKIDFSELRGQIQEELTKVDQRAVELLGGYYDVQNLVAAYSGHGALHSVMGNLSQDQISQLLTQDNLEDYYTEDLDEMHLNSEVFRMLMAIRGLQESDDDDLVLEDNLSQSRVEDLLFSSYYKGVGLSDSLYLKCWVNADRLMRTYIVASENESQLDPELLSEIKEQEWFTELRAVIDTKDFVKREHKMDALRWQVAQDLTEPGGVDGALHDFDIAAVLCYLIKLNILQRWAVLSKEVGRERFDQMVKSFTVKGSL